MNARPSRDAPGYAANALPGTTERLSDVMRCGRAPRRSRSVATSTSESACTVTGLPPKSLRDLPPVGGEQLGAALRCSGQFLRRGSRFLPDELGAVGGKDYVV